MKARVLVADCPWASNDKLGERGAAANYPVLSIEDLERFPLPEMEDDSVLFFWKLSSMPEEAYRVIRAWNFVPKTELVWEKTTQGGEPAFGMGHILRGSHETCVVATRGKVNGLVKNHSIRTRFAAPRGAHSEKPAVFYDIVRALFDGPYVALFERVERPGFDCYGDELGRPSPYVEDDPWEHGRRLALRIERPERDERLAYETIATVIGVDYASGPDETITIELPRAHGKTTDLAAAALAADAPRKRGRRSNATILSDIANGLQRIGVDVSLVTIATWDRDQKNAAEDYIKILSALDGTKPQPPMPGFIAEAMRPTVEQPPRKATDVEVVRAVHADNQARTNEANAAFDDGFRKAMRGGVIHAPDVGPLDDREVTYEEWVAQAVREDLISAELAATLTPHDAYCRVMTAAPTGWFARARTVILKMADPTPGIVKGKPTPWARAAEVACRFAEAES